MPCRITSSQWETLIAEGLLQAGCSHCQVSSGFSERTWRLTAAWPLISRCPVRLIHGRRYPYMCMHRLDSSSSTLHIQGEAMAGRLYIDAVERQSIPADPEIMAYLRLHQPSEAAVGSNELPSQLSSQALSSQAPAAAKQKPRGGNKRQKSSKDPAVSHSLSLPCCIHMLELINLCELLKLIFALASNAHP